MQKLVTVVLTTIAYLALAWVSADIASTEVASDAWTVWLASGLTLGILCARPQREWGPPLIGVVLGAALFELLLQKGKVMNVVGYAAIEVLAGTAGAFVASRLAPIPLRLRNLTELSAIIVGALGQALTGALLAALWSVATASDPFGRTFGVWALSSFIGALLIAPLIVSWSGFRVKRSGGLTMGLFVGGLIAAVLLMVELVLFSYADTFATLRGTFVATLTYPAVLLIAIVALCWGARGATLMAFVSALVALFATSDGHGLFAASHDLGEARLEVQGYAATLALTGLIVAALMARLRDAWRAARDWRTRFEAAINAHRMIAYEWDPVTGALAVTGDTIELLGVPNTGIATLADWLGRVAEEDRDAATQVFALRADGASMPVANYRARDAQGASVTLVDDAQAIRDHDGALHRVVGIVRVAGAAA